MKCPADGMFTKAAARGACEGMEGGQWRVCTQAELELLEQPSCAGDEDWWVRDADTNELSKVPGDQLWQ